MTTLAVHLLQSTLFGTAVASIILLFRNNSARVRHALWMAASVKFLIPFTIFTALVPHVALPRDSAPAAVLMKISQPLDSQGPRRTMSRAVSAPVERPFPFTGVAFGPWFAGFAAVSVSRLIRLNRVSREIRRAPDLQSGREFEAVTRMRRAFGFESAVTLRLSSGSIEPGTFGIWRPVLSLPRGISECLGEQQLEGVVAHELIHILRHDNLTGAIHMVVESLFWFHPLVWWIGSRMIDERERACDEAVVELGVDPETYARGILNVCRFYVQSPVACVAGVTGANLTQRIENIMARREAAKVSFGRKLMLIIVGTAGIGLPALIGQPSAEKRLTFEVASVKPNTSNDFRGVPYSFCRAEDLLQPTPLCSCSSRLHTTCPFNRRDLPSSPASTSRRAITISRQPPIRARFLRGCRPWSATAA